MKSIFSLLKISFLIAACLTTSGYRFRCYFACIDQTSTQNDYVEQRDYCREYAQLKVKMGMREIGADPGDDKARKSTLVSLFSSCMGANGWTVPDGKVDPKNPVAIAAAAAAPSAAVIATNKAEEKANLTRSAECAFARHSASVSSNASVRAEACDLECAEALRLSPNAPRPPSCPSNLPAKYAKGHEE